MRVLITTGIFPPDIGGPATYAPVVAASLAARGHAVCVLTLADGSRGHDEDIGYTVRRVRRSLWKPLRWVKVILEVLNESAHCDVVLVNGLQLETAAALCLRPRRMVIRVGGDIAYEQARNRGWVSDPFDKFQSKRYRARVEVLRSLRTWPLRRADAIIVNSAYMGDQVRRWGLSSTRVKVIYSSVEVPASLSAQHGREPGTATFISVCRFLPVKRLDGLINAFATLPRGRLVLVGDGPLTAELKLLVRNLGIENRVIFAGRRSVDEVFSWLAGSDVFVLNSEWEIFPHAVLEAMSVGLPVIATNTGGTREIIENGRDGVLISPDAALLATEMLKLADDAAYRRNLGDAAARKARTQFSRERMLVQTEGVLLGR